MKPAARRKKQASLKTTLSALESHLDYLLTRAKYGHKLSALGYLAYDEVQMLRWLQSDKSLPTATRKRLIKERASFLGQLVWKATLFKNEQEMWKVMTGKHGPAQHNQHKVFCAYRAVLRRIGRPPTITEWMVEDSKNRQTQPTNEYKTARGLVLREMAKRFKLPWTPAGQHKS